MKNLKNKLSYAIYFVLAFFTVSCNHLEEGVVTKHEYQSPRTYVMIMPMVISTGKSTTTMMIPYTIFDGEDYVLTVKGEYDGEIVSEEVYVTKECYESLENGQLWVMTDDCSFSDPNNDKTRNE